METQYNKDGKVLGKKGKRVSAFPPNYKIYQLCCLRALVYSMTQRGFIFKADGERIFNLLSSNIHQARKELRTQMDIKRIKQGKLK